MNGWKILAAVAAVSSAVIPSVAVSASASAAPGGYATVMFGRSGYVEANPNCTPMIASETLDDAVQWLYNTQGISSIGGLTTGRTLQSTEFCDDNYILYPSWDELAALQSEYGFDLVSQSATYTGWKATNTTPAISAESCATIPTFKAHGFNNSWSLFDPPDNQITAQQLAVVQGCFAFNRKYNTTIDAQAVVSSAPYTLGTMSVTSGENCNDIHLACYNQDPGGKKYMLPSQISKELSPTAGHYNVVQFYRFVIGITPEWNCSGPDPKTHWVKTDFGGNLHELYCFNDFQNAIKGRAAGTVFTTPDVVASQWMPARAATLAAQ